MELIGPGTVQPLRELVILMNEMIDSPLLLANRRQQFADHALQHGHILRQIRVGIRGAVRHTPGTREPTRRFGRADYFSEECSAGFAYRGRRFAFKATPPRIRDNSVALIDTPAASPITFGNSKVPRSKRFCQTT